MNVGTRNTRTFPTLLFCFLSKMHDFLWKSDNLVIIQLVKIPQFFCRTRYRLILTTKAHLEYVVNQFNAAYAFRPYLGLRPAIFLKV